MKLKICLSLGCYFGTPKVKIAVDDCILLHDGVAQENFEFDVPLDDGNHQLKITHYGKTVDDHLLNSSGKIIQDKFIHIKQVFLDETELHSELWEAKFFPVYLHKTEDDPLFLSPNLYLGHNGTWILEFFTPALKWLIDRRQPGPDLSNTIFKTSRDMLADVKKIFLDLPDV